MRAVERRGDRVEGGKACIRCRRREEFAPFTHLGREERFEDAACLAATRGDHQAAVHDLDSCRSRDFEPDVARALGPLPAGAALLAGHGDKAEVADRRAVRLGVTVDDYDPLAAAGGGERVRQAADACPDDCEIVVPRMHAAYAAVSR